MYKCSECHAEMGPILDANGKPELFKCHKYGTFAHIVPEILQGRKPPRPGVAVRELKIKARNVIRKRFVDGELEP